jgi:IS5 family transposase
LEEAVKDRISFIRFSGLSISSALPDHSTICRFRNALFGPPISLRNSLPRSTDSTPAHVADITRFEKLLDEASLAGSVPILADKGYSSMRNREILAERGYVDGIMHKAVRGRPLTFMQHLINRFISSVRYKIEQDTGTLKRGYHFSRMRYIGAMKGNMEFMLTAMAFNLKKAVLMME